MGKLYKQAGLLDLVMKLRYYITSNIRKSNGLNRYSVVAGSYLNIPIFGYSVDSYKLVDLQASVENTKSILDNNDQTAIASLTREDILGDLFYSGGLGYFAQLNTMNKMASTQGKGVGTTLFGYGSYGYEPKIKTAGILAIPIGINTGSIATNMLLTIQSTAKNGNPDDQLNMAYQMGMNGSILESAISEQLFCNSTVNLPDENGIQPECYGISTVSGLSRAGQAGQKIYQLTRDNINNASFATSGADMTNDIMRTINAGGTVMVPERAVEGAGRSAIYVYALLKADGSSSWKISGGLNGAFFAGVSIGAALYGITALGGVAGALATPLGPLLLVALVALLIVAIALLIIDLTIAWSQGSLEETIQCGASGILAGYYFPEAIFHKLVGNIAKVMFGISLIGLQGAYKQCF